MRELSRGREEILRMPGTPSSRTDYQHRQRYAGLSGGPNGFVEWGCQDLARDGAGLQMVLQMLEQVVSHPTEG